MNENMHENTIIQFVLGNQHGGFLSCDIEQLRSLFLIELQITRKSFYFFKKKIGIILLNRLYVVKIGELAPLCVEECIFWYSN